MGATIVQILLMLTHDVYIQIMFLAGQVKVRSSQQNEQIQSLNQNNTATSTATVAQLSNQQKHWQISAAIYGSGKAENKIRILQITTFL